MSEYYVSYHIKSKSTSRNSCRIAVSYYKMGDYGTLIRTMKHKGFDYMFVLNVEVSEDEFNRESLSKHRINFILYDNWDSLEKDEQKFDRSKDFLEKIKLLKDKFKISSDGQITLAFE